MFYLQAIKKLYEHIKTNSEIPKDEKVKAQDLLNELSRLLALY